VSRLRFFRELSLLLATVGGAALGYAAGAHLPSQQHVIVSFAGMALGGAFADWCLRGGK